MLKLMINELIKIFKRKNIYILLAIGIVILLVYNIYCYIFNMHIDKDIRKLYEMAYKQDNLYLNNYENLNIKENYYDIVERVALEKYAIENNIPYNILLNTENKNIILPTDARILLMKIFNNFDIILIIILIYLSSTMIAEEYSNGTIKKLFIKPHKRTTILLLKLLTTITVILILFIFIILLQFLLGGLLFGFESYTLDAIRYNHITNNIEFLDLGNYIILITLCKLPMYILIILTSFLLGIITHNIAVNILVCFSLYILSNIEISFNNITKYLIIYNWDISKYLYGEIFNTSILHPIIICITAILLILVLSIYLFNKKDITCE